MAKMILKVKSSTKRVDKLKTPSGDGMVLNVMPNSASWGYTMKTNKIDTYGGQVIQVLSFSLDSLTVSGYMLPSDDKGSRWQSMLDFEQAVASIMDYHTSSKKPIDLELGAFGWSGKVFLTGYSDVRYNMESNAIEYKIMFFVDSGFSDVVNTISDQAALSSLKRLHSGVEYVRNQYNTPLEEDWELVKKAFETALKETGTLDAMGKSIYDYIDTVSKKDDENASDEGLSGLGTDFGDLNRPLYGAGR